MQKSRPAVAIKLYGWTWLIAAIAIVLCGNSASANVTCRTYMKGSVEYTVFCPNGFKCIADDKCSRALTKKELKKEIDRLKKLSDDLKQMRRGMERQNKRWQAEAKARNRAGSQVFRRETRLLQSRYQTRQRSGASHASSSCSPQDFYNFNCACKPKTVTAGWHAVCSPGETTSRSLRLHRYTYRKNIIAPQTLYRRAAQGCNGVHWSQRTKCISLGKTRILMELSPTIREDCGSKSEKERAKCVDLHYIDASEESLRIQILLKLVSGYRIADDLTRILPPF